MKKLLAFLLALSINSYSQNIGLELGVGSSKAKVSDGTTSISTDTYSGFLAGLVSTKDRLKLLPSAIIFVSPDKIFKEKL